MNKTIILTLLLSSISWPQEFIVLNDSLNLYDRPDTNSRIVFNCFKTEMVSIDSTRVVANSNWKYVRTQGFQDQKLTIPTAGWARSIIYADSQDFVKITDWKFSSKASLCMGDYCPEFEFRQNGRVTRYYYKVEENNKCNDNEQFRNKKCVSEGNAYKFKDIIWVNIDGWQTFDFFIINSKGHLCAPICCKFRKNGECGPN